MRDERYLNAGPGLCRAQAQLIIKPVQAVAELGALPDVINKALKAVHSANREGNPDDYIAVALPRMHKVRKVYVPGDVISLFGSEEALTGLLDAGRIRELKRRGMILDEEPEDVDFDIGDTGAAYVRLRTGDKKLAGELRRRQARAARRGTEVGNPRKNQTDFSDRLRLFFGDRPVAIKETLAEYAGEPLYVSTYGFSAQSAPAVLPITPESAFEVDDAA